VKIKVRWPDVLAMLGFCIVAVGVAAWFFYSIPA